MNDYNNIRTGNTLEGGEGDFTSQWGLDAAQDTFTYAIEAHRGGACYKSFTRAASLKAAYEAALVLWPTSEGFIAHFAPRQGDAR